MASSSPGKSWRSANADETPAHVRHARISGEASSLTRSATGRTAGREAETLLHALSDVEVAAEVGGVLGEARGELVRDLHVVQHRQRRLLRAAQHDAVRRAAVACVAQPREGHRRRGRTTRKLQHLLLERDRDVQAGVKLPLALPVHREAVRAAASHLVLLEHDDSLAKLRKRCAAREAALAGADDDGVDGLGQGSLAVRYMAQPARPLRRQLRRLVCAGLIQGEHD